MRNNNSGCGPVFVAIIMAFVCGAILIAWLTQADPLKPQPSQAVVSAAYATRARIENDAARDRLVAELAHKSDMLRIERETAQAFKDLGIVAGGAAAILALYSFGHYAVFQSHTHGRTIRPNKRGQFPIMVDRARGTLTNPNLQTTAVITIGGTAEPLTPEQQLEAYAWQQRANIAASMSSQKVMPITAMQERKIIQSGVMPALPQPGTPAPVDATTGEFRMADDDTGIHIHDAPERPARNPASNPASAIVNTSNGGIPNDIGTEQEFNDFISRGN